MRRLRARRNDYSHPIGEYAKKEKIPFGPSEIILIIVIILGIIVTFGTYYLFVRDQGVVYEQVGADIHVVGYEGREKDVVIFDEYDGRKVTTIAQGAFKDNQVIESITLGRNITAIQSRAFYNAVNLSDITLLDAEALLEVTPDILTNTPYHNTQEGPLYFIGSALYDGQSFSQSRLTIPEATNLIGTRAFSENTFIQEIVFNQSLHTIGEEAFAAMPNLETLIFEETINLQVIASRAFYNAVSLEIIEAPSQTTIQRIGSDAFTNTPWRNAQDYDYYQFGDIRIEEPINNE